MHRTDRRQLRWNGWGAVDHTFDLTGREKGLWSLLQKAVGRPPADTPAVPLESCALLPSRLTDADLDHLRRLLGAQAVHTDRFERLFHAAGKSYYDIIRLRMGRVDAAPDAVVYPGNTEQVQALLAWASEQNVAVIPFGGGSSVVGGVEAQGGPGHRAVLTLDTTRLCAVLGIDPVSRLATVQAGIYGPELEEALQARGWTLGHYPQSFEYSTVGGWIAARGAGQQSNRYGTPADMLCSARVVTPTGLLQTRDFPQSAAGPNVNHTIAGSEGILGVIVDATLRVRPAPPARDFCSLLMPSFGAGADLIRTLVQEELPVATLRLSDAEETRFFAEFSAMKKTAPWQRAMFGRALRLTPWGGDPCMLLVGLVGTADEVADTRRRVAQLGKAAGGLVLGSGPGHRWYEHRFEMPYLRDPLLDRGYAVDTLETSTPWSNIGALHLRVREALRKSVEATGSTPIVMAHISHAYADGASLYFTFLFARDLQDPIGQWRRIKHAASDTILAHGGTISHHHGVGLDHLPWMDADKGPHAIAALRATRQALDPAGIMNPGKLLP